MTDELRKETERLKAIAAKASPGPWTIRTQREDFFVEANGFPNMPYRLDVCGEDYTGHGDDAQRRCNYELIAAAHEAVDHASALQSELDRLRQQLAERGEPVAWLHDNPDRVDVIHDEVKKLLVDSHDAAGYLNRPVDKSKRYTIPLYKSPPAQSAVPPEREMLRRIVDELSIIDESNGIAGFHLNGDVSPWDEGELPRLRDEAQALLDAAAPPAQSAPSISPMTLDMAVEALESWAKRMDRNNLGDPLVALMAREAAKELTEKLAAPSASESQPGHWHQKIADPTAIAAQRGGE